MKHFQKIETCIAKNLQTPVKANIFFCMFIIFGHEMNFRVIVKDCAKKTWRNMFVQMLICVGTPMFVSTFDVGADEGKSWDT